jgi:hypothetical protein
MGTERFYARQQRVRPMLVIDFHESLAESLAFFSLPFAHSRVYDFVT